MSAELHAEWADLVDYLAGELDAGREDALEAHLMACERCAAEAEHVASLTEGIRSLLPPLASGRTLEALRRRGLRIEETELLPGSDRKAVLGPHLDVLVLRLRGVDPAAVSATFTMRTIDTGDVVLQLHDVPIDPASGSVLLLCSPHYASLSTSPDVVARVTTRDGAGAEAVSEYTIRHVFQE